MPGASRSAASTEGLEFIVSDLASWPPGSTVRVAFLDGDRRCTLTSPTPPSRSRMSCNLTLDFGLDPATGRVPALDRGGHGRAAEIRVSFDHGRLLVAGRHRQHGHDHRRAR